MGNSSKTPRPLTGRTVLFYLLAFFGIVMGVNVVMIKLAIDTLPGTEVEFCDDGAMVYIRKPVGGHTRGREIVEHLRRASGGDIKMSTEEIMRLTRGEDWGTGRLEEDDGGHAG